MALYVEDQPPSSASSSIKVPILVIVDNLEKHGGSARSMLTESKGNSLEPDISTDVSRISHDSGRNGLNSVTKCSNFEL